jgi:hypothetical protein
MNHALPTSFVKIITPAGLTHTTRAYRNFLAVVSNGLKVSMCDEAHYLGQSYGNAIFKCETPIAFVCNMTLKLIESISTMR